jgi:hypothetical protein
LADFVQQHGNQIAVASLGWSMMLQMPTGLLPNGGTLIVRGPVAFASGSTEYQSMVVGAARYVRTVNGWTNTSFSMKH